MLSWMYWPHRAQETTRSGGERREPTLSNGRQTPKQADNEVLELTLVEPEEEFGNDPYNRVGPLSRRQKPPRMP